ncbi:hypothetical protein [Candidatus Magnetobacterium casense]|uniref:Transposase n=1 Tax=Candidatus Magnetobacterium casense TaxID=1455061 RepID=A0ABS6S2X5_9BACT|nr:hypothetical protein [Candidatus Magnetobacterium casensis]MBV6343204.1 hypothetical protein [Candidatus Magnetobacterium casensis]
MANKRVTPYDEAGRLGGLATLRRYGRDQLATWGKLGGRPRSATYDDIRQRQLLEQNKNKEVMVPPGTLREQKRLFAARQRSNGVMVTSIEEAWIAQGTPREQVPAGGSETRS